jgi:DNA-directed RNA polymerase subunit RPC12/RpoP
MERENTVVKELILFDLFGQVETALYENEPEQAQRIITELCDWPLRETKSVRKYGSVIMGPKRVVLMSSIHMSGEQYNNTLLHEVGHIIHWLITGDCNHDRWWRHYASMIGCDIYRSNDVTFREAANKVKASRTKLVAKCTGCGKEWHRMRRLNRGRIYSCPHCGSRVERI